VCPRLWYRLCCAGGNIAEAIQGKFEIFKYNKQVVMMKAFDECNKNEIRSDELRQLVFEIKSALERLFLELNKKNF